MRPSNHKNRRQQISDLLAQHPDGLTRAEIEAALEMSNDGFGNAIKRMPNVYIDRWKAKRYRMPTKGFRMMWVAVYCLAEAPPDAPKPERSPNEEDFDDQADD